MNLFVHGKMHHFMQEADGEGGDLPGGEPSTEEEPEEEQEEPEEEDEEVTVTIDGDEPSEEETRAAEEEKTAPQWVRDVRKANKELAKKSREDERRIRELEEKLNKPATAQELPALGKKPTMEDEDVDWDSEKFEQKLTAWHDRKREIDNAEVQQRQQADAQKAEWDGKLKAYGEAKVKLKVADFDDAESVVMGMFDQTQQGIIIDAMDNPAMVIYALGRNKKTAERLAAIKKPTQFLREMARLEDTKLKVQSKKSAPPPEKTVSGQGRISGAVDSTLEKLREEAAKTGDSSKVIAYKRDQKRKAKG